MILNKELILNKYKNNAIILNQKNNLKMNLIYKIVNYQDKDHLVKL